VNFFKTALHASFKKSDGMVYVLPEARSIDQVFAAFYDVNQKEKSAAAGQEDPIAKFAARQKSQSKFKG
jgi:hypothetical protein